MPGLRMAERAYTRKACRKYSRLRRKYPSHRPHRGTRTARTNSLHVLRLGGPGEDVVRECPARLTGRTSDSPPISPEEIYARWPATLLINNRARIPGTRPR